MSVESLLNSVGVLLRPNHFIHLFLISKKSRWHSFPAACCSISTVLRRKKLSIVWSSSDAVETNGADVWLGVACCDDDSADEEDKDEDEEEENSDSIATTVLSVFSFFFSVFSVSVGSTLGVLVKARSVSALATAIGFDFKIDFTARVATKLRWFGFDNNWLLGFRLVSVLLL